MSSYAEFFKTATGYQPYPYQEQVARQVPFVLEIPTGLGKTEATVLGWLYRRLTDPNNVPRRLFYCLPMRTLVEQTRDRIANCFEGLQKLSIKPPHLDVVMGGDVGERWFREPEISCVVIGTQDMLLSRALNRGYAMNRFQWPMTFAAANDDAYWVIDEVQLQGIGAVTATQFHAFRERFGTFHRTEITLASATIDPSWFETADFSLTGHLHISLSADDLANPNVEQVVRAKKRLEGVEAKEPQEIAELILQRHRGGTRTLVIVNQVSRAQEIYKCLQRLNATAEIVLLHSRFRPQDRKAHTLAMLAEPVPSAGRIVIATQVVEAGVDVSASTLITDVAPWSSLVQRFGRCNRYGSDQNGTCIWLDCGDIKKSDAGPYHLDDLVKAQEVLRELNGTSAAPQDLPKRPIPLRSGLVIRKTEFLDLFDTSLDLSGHHVDVGPYIREADDASVSLFWRDNPPDEDDIPQPEEFCTAPLSAVDQLVKELRKADLGAKARTVNQFSQDENRSWAEVHPDEIHPGLIVWLCSDVGWYDPQLGFIKKQGHVAEIHRQRNSDFSDTSPLTDSDVLAQAPFPVELSQHAQDSMQQALALVTAVGIQKPFSEAITAAALWHDVGKAHPIFQETMRRANVNDNGGTTLWAKGVRRRRHSRRGFRHELPGTLAFLNAHDGEPSADLIAYLIAAHHGKLRVATQQLPYEAPIKPFQFLGCQDGEALPKAELGGGVVSPPLTLSLDAFKVGSQNAARAWVDRTIGLRDDPTIGPFRLAYMELLVRLADWNASASEAKCP
jgi:CRISPR-associated endonuclease/helicase Cas3